VNTLFATVDDNSGYINYEGNITPCHTSAHPFANVQSYNLVQVTTMYKLLGLVSTLFYVAQFMLHWCIVTDAELIMY
jgi:hypothetical protein